MKFKPLALSLAAATALIAVHGAASAITLPANPTANNGGSPGWGIFFDVQAAAGQVITITDLTTASTAAANGSFSIEVFTRIGSGLGGPLAAGPGSSSAGWTSLGSAAGTQGAIASGISLSVDIPDFVVSDGATVGVALLFTGAGPRYFGTGTAALQTFSDGALTLVAGDARTVPFTGTGSFFSSRALTGSLGYDVSPVPEPATWAFMAFGLAGLMAWRRRQV